MWCSSWYLCKDDRCFSSLQGRRSVLPGRKSSTKLRRNPVILQASPQCSVFFLMCINFFTGFIICNGEHPPMNIIENFCGSSFEIPDEPKYSSKRSEFLRFYCYFCHVCRFIHILICSTKIGDNPEGHNNGGVNTLGEKVCLRLCSEASKAAEVIYERLRYRKMPFRKYRFQKVCSTQKGKRKNVNG